MQNIGSEGFRIDINSFLNNSQRITKFLYVQVRSFMGDEFKNLAEFAAREPVEEPKLSAEGHPFVHGHDFGTGGNVVEGTMRTPYVALFAELVEQVPEMSVRNAQ